MDDNVANAMAIIKRAPARQDKEELASYARKQVWLMCGMQAMERFHRGG